MDGVESGNEQCRVNSSFQKCLMTRKFSLKKLFREGMVVSPRQLQNIALSPVAS